MLPSRQQSNRICPIPWIEIPAVPLRADAPLAIVQLITVVVDRDPPPLNIDLEMPGVELLPGLAADLGHCPASEHHLSQHLADFPGCHCTKGSVIAVV
jgi:hypothetical protein